MERRRRRQSLLAEMNVVPYIDVMLVLLVIFMITTPLLTQGVKINMPQAKAKVLSGKEQAPIIVSVDATGNYYLNVADKPEVPMAVQALVVRVAAEVAVAQEKQAKRSIFIKGDSDVDYGKVVRAMVLLQQAGVEEIGLMTQTPATKTIHVSR